MLFWVDMTPQRDDILNHIKQKEIVENPKKYNENGILCRRLDCRLPVVCRCTECEFFYCYEHLKQHPHPSEKWEIIR